MASITLVVRDDKDEEEREWWALPEWRLGWTLTASRESHVPTYDRVARWISPPQIAEQVRIATYEHVVSSGLMDKLCWVGPRSQFPTTLVGSYYDTILLSCPATICVEYLVQYNCSTTQMYVILFFLEVSCFKISSFFKIQIWVPM